MGRDPLFFPGLLEPMGKGQLRVFGDGKNKVSFTYVDNYCHGLILGVDSLYKVRDMRNSVMYVPCLLAIARWRRNGKL